MSLSKSQRGAVFAMFAGHCAYCGCVLPEKGWHVDHIKPVDREWWKAHRPKETASWVDGKVVMVPTDRKVTIGRPERDCIENMYPSCAPCNIDKGAVPLEYWRKGLERRVEVCRRNHSAFRHAERFGLIAQVKTEVIFYFETLAISAPLDSGTNNKETL